MACVVALLSAIALATAGCSGEKAVSVAASDPARSSGVGTTGPRGVGAVHLVRSVPVRLEIEAIGVDSELMDLGLRDDGTMEVPAKGFPAGWYTGAPTPGELGPAIIAGHVDLKGPGVFHELHTLKSGDQVIVTRQDGSRPVFRVTRVARFPKDQFPTSLVYGDIDHAGLRLITCGGAFDQASGHYEENVVAFAELVPAP